MSESDVILKKDDYEFLLEGENTRCTNVEEAITGYFDTWEKLLEENYFGDSLQPVLLELGENLRLIVEGQIVSIQGDRKKAMEEFIEEFNDINKLSLNDK